MEITYQEKGEYLRGLLVLIGKDNIIDEKERQKIVEIGQKFGFSRSFCEEAVTDFLENEFISTEPPFFSDNNITERFLDDAIDLSIIDNDFHIEELEWLEKIAIRNGIETSRLDEKIRTHVLEHKSKLNVGNDQ